MKRRFPCLNGTGEALLYMSAEVKTGSVHYACVRKTAENRPREQNPDALQTLAEVKTDSVR